MVIEIYIFQTLTDLITFDELLCTSVCCLKLKSNDCKFKFIQAHYFIAQHGFRSTKQRNKIAINLSHSRYPSKQSQLRNSDQHTSTIIQSLYENESLRATPTHDEKKREKRQAFAQNH